MNLDYIKKNLVRLYQERDISQIASTLSAQQKLDVLEYANVLYNDQIYFDKDWDMERCTTVYPFDAKDWNTTYHNDEEWCFMKNRMDYVKDLIVASYVSEDLKYMQKAKSWILAWILAHPYMKSEPSTRTLDSGIRMQNIMETMIFLYHKNLLDDQELIVIIKSLQQHVDYMKASYVAKYTLSNWGSIQTCAILNVLPLWEENPLQHPIYQWASKELQGQIEIQVYPDGMHWEQSTMYHVEVLIYILRYIQYQRFYHVQVSEEVVNVATRMMDALYVLATPEMKIDTFGDSDRVDISELCTLAGTILKDNRWKYRTCKSISSDVYVMLGTNAVIEYQRLCEQVPRNLVYDGEDSGIFTFRDGWEDTSSYTMITHGSLGSGHGHSDNLHVSFYHKGKAVLIDAGRYTYREDEKLRVYLKGVHGHNGILVDEKTNCLPSDSWSYQDFGIPLKPYVKHLDNIHYFEGTMLGHDPLQVWTRKVITIDSSIWMIVDEIKQDGIHTLKQFFHLDPTCEITKTIFGYQSVNVDIDMYIDGETNRRKDVCSLRYNEVCEHQVLISKREFEDSTQQIHSFVKCGIQVKKAIVYQDNVAFSEDVCSARTFILSNQESYTIAIFHKEIYKGKKICYIHDVPFHAKAIVLHEVDGIKKLIRIKM